MISFIEGTVEFVSANLIALRIGPMVVDVCIPKFLESRFEAGQKAALYTYTYLKMDSNIVQPVIIGFASPVEREFFGLFITVSGVGPKAALKAFSEPVQKIASAIAEEDYAFLKKLPGIGAQRAKEIVAKLQSKVAKFALLKDIKGVPPRSAEEDLSKDEAIFEQVAQVLSQLQYSRQEIKGALARLKGADAPIVTIEDALTYLYRQKILK